MSVTRSGIEESFKTIQASIIKGLEDLDGSNTFASDKWEREGGGGGNTCVFTDGALFEKAGVNFSSVYGDLPEALKNEFKIASADFFATGVSLVIHPLNPWIPIVHMNVRYFEIPGEDKWWFGGGIDLTPIYINVPQAKAFHQKLKVVCDKFSPEFYPKFKKWADDYFFIEHRKETRGVGGIFFDKLNEESTGLSKQQLFDFVCEIGNTFLHCYAPIVQNQKHHGHTEQEKNWQLIRRGRYVEFNLVYDRGTHFGLKTNGRVESILMSLPKMVSWEYNHTPRKDSAEEETLKYLKKGIDWV